MFVAWLVGWLAFYFISFVSRSLEVSKHAHKQQTHEHTNQFKLRHQLFHLHHQVKVKVKVKVKEHSQAANKSGSINNSFAGHLRTLATILSRSAHLVRSLNSNSILFFLSQSLYHSLDDDKSKHITYSQSSLSLSLSQQIVFCCLKAASFTFLMK